MLSAFLVFLSFVSLSVRQFPYPGTLSSCYNIFMNMNFASARNSLSRLCRNFYTLIVLVVICLWRMDILFDVLPGLALVVIAGTFLINHEAILITRLLAQAQKEYADVPVWQLMTGLDLYLADRAGFSVQRLRQALQFNLSRRPEQEQNKPLYDRPVYWYYERTSWLEMLHSLAAMAILFLIVAAVSLEICLHVSGILHFAGLFMTGAALMMLVLSLLIYAGAQRLDEDFITVEAMDDLRGSLFLQACLEAGIRRKKKKKGD